MEKFYDSYVPMNVVTLDLRMIYKIVKHGFHLRVAERRIS
jgi:hypothetical protein